MDIGGIDGGHLRNFVDRIENIEEEIKDFNASKAQVYREAKGSGFDVKILKELIARRRKNESERDEHDTLLDLYERAISAPPSRVRAHEAAKPAEATLA